MTTRLSYQDKEALCRKLFNELEEVYHGCTAENHPIIFHNDEDFKTAITLLAVCKHKHTSVIIITFEIMNNHLHLVVAGRRKEIELMFDDYKGLLQKHLSPKKEGVHLNDFNLKLHKIQDLENLRNVIAYVNRNGSVIDDRYSPYSYPWGANRFYFNQEATKRHLASPKLITVKERRELTHSRKYDHDKLVVLIDDYASPLHFCDIRIGENLFRDCRHYFYKVSRSIECYEEIAHLIGENIFYTDEDIFQIACNLSQKQYNLKSPYMLPQDAKIKFAKVLRYDYNANLKQIQRMLKIDQGTLKALFGE